MIRYTRFDESNLARQQIFKWVHRIDFLLFHVILIMKIPQVEYFGPYSDRAIHDASSFPKAHSSDVQSYSLLHSRCRNPSLEDESEYEGVALPDSKPGASKSPIGQLFVEHLHPSFARSRTVSVRSLRSTPTSISLLSSINVTHSGAKSSHRSICVPPRLQRRSIR